MRGKITTTFIALLLAGATQLEAQTTKASTDTMRVSLKQAQDYAMQHGNTAANNALDNKITKWRTVEILAQGLPIISATGGIQNTYKIGTSLIPAKTFVPGSPDGTYLKFPQGGTPTAATLNLSVFVPIVDGRYVIGLKANKAFLAVAKEQTNVTEIQVRNSVANAYYAALVSEESRRIIDDNLKNVKQLKYETGELYKAGFSEELDLDRITLSQSNLESQMNEAIIRAELAKAVLKEQLGLEMSSPLVLTDSLEGLFKNNPTVIDSTLDYTSRPEYKLLQLSNTIKGYDAMQTRFSGLPTISGYFNYGATNYLVSGYPWFPSGNVGLTLSIPIFDSYRTGSVYQQKKLTQLKAKNDMEHFKLQAELQLKAARTNYLNALTDFETQKRSIALAQKIYDRVKAKNKEGLASSFELAQAETDLTQTQGNYVNSIYNLLLQKTELDKALGKY